MNRSPRITQTTRISCRMVGGVVCAMLIGVMAATAQADNPLDPTPAISPAEVAEMLKKRGVKALMLAGDAKRPKEMTITGAVTVQEKGRIGFMPLLQHHMAVEHWFISGLSMDQLKDKLSDGKRCFVKLRGTRVLRNFYRPWGDGVITGGKDWYGNGLPHGKIWGGPGGGVMGYHERVYTFKADKLVWVKNASEFQSLKKAYRAKNKEMNDRIAEGKYPDAMRLMKEAAALAADVGIARRGGGKLESYIKDMILLTKAPSNWSDEEAAQVGKVLVSSEDWPFSYRKKGGKVIETTIKTWPTDVRERVGPVAVTAWKELKYKFQRDSAMKFLRLLGGAHARKLEKDVAEAHVKLKQLKAQLAKRVADRDYKGVKAVAEKMVAPQALTLSYEFEAVKIKAHLLQAKDCMAIEKAIGEDKDPAGTIEKVIFNTYLSKDTTHLAFLRSTSRGELHLTDQMVSHLLPRLKEEDRRKVEAALIRKIKKLDPRKKSYRIMLLSELLVGAAGEDAKEFMPGLIRRMKGAPKWHMRLMNQFHEKIKRKAK